MYLYIYTLHFRVYFNYICVYMCMYVCICYTGPFSCIDLFTGEQKIKGPDDPTSQLLPKMIHKCCRGDGEGRKDKGCDGGSTRTKNGRWQSRIWKMLCDKERWCVWKLCVKVVCERERVKCCVWKMVCDKVVCECREAMSGKTPSEQGGTRRRRVRHIVRPFARSNRLCSNLHTQVSHANVTSIAKSPMSPKLFTQQ